MESDQALMERRVRLFIKAMFEWNAMMVEESDSLFPQANGWNSVEDGLEHDLQPLDEDSESEETNATFDRLRREHARLIGRHLVRRDAFNHLGFSDPPEHHPIHERISNVTVLGTREGEVATEYHFESAAFSRIYRLTRQEETWLIDDIFELAQEGVSESFEEDLGLVARPDHTSYTTRPAPVDLERLIPAFAEFAAPAIRLHPRRHTELPQNVSKCGGSFLGNDRQSWPVCHHHRTPYVGVVQLTQSELPGELDLFPPGKTVMQLLWCPFDHGERCCPRVEVQWLDGAGAQSTGKPNPVPRRSPLETTPRQCQFHPEVIMDYPDFLSLHGSLQTQVSRHPELQRLGKAIYPETFVHEDDDSGEQSPAASGPPPVDELAVNAYHVLLGSAPGFKIGGHPDWIQEAEVPSCVHCDAAMDHLLTVASWEWDGASYERWRPAEEPLEPGGAGVEDAGLMLGDAGAIYLFVCRSCPDWPVSPVFQSS